MAATTGKNGKKRVSVAPSALMVIRSEHDLDSATRELCGLISAGRALSGVEHERLHFLTSAVEAGPTLMGLFVIKGSSAAKRLAVAVNFLNFALAQTYSAPRSGQSELSPFATQFQVACS